MPQRYQNGIKGCRKRTPEEVIQDFWLYVEKRGTNECWPWLGAVNEGGYGLYNGGLAHRFSYSVHQRTIPKDQQVLHTCDNPPCVNPRHLFEGDQLRNIADMVGKSRQRAPRKLSPDDVRFIRFYYASLKNPARRCIESGRREALLSILPIDASVLNRIVQRKGKSWKNVL